MNQFFRLQCAVRGIYSAARNDISYRTQIWGGGIVVVLLLITFPSLTSTELLFLFLGWFLILITELQNSAFERALDRLHPEQHTQIGYSKDMAAGAVLTAGIFFLMVVLTICYQQLT